MDYERDIKPILRARCYACHGALKQEASLRLDTAASIRKGGDSGPAIALDRGGESLLLARVMDADAASRMPPEGAPLSKEQVQLLADWVGSGAASPAEERPDEDPREHWAFQPPQQPDVPIADVDGRVRNPIDALLHAERQARGLTLVEPAPPHVLVRRLYLDLIGLPPTREELQAYCETPTDDAYERLVDQLLTDPRHGERWARHWMDVWRYSDWYGRRTTPDVLNSYGMIWRWRDWIVESLNANRPYDEMVQMMLAADELAPTLDADLVATGLLVRNFFRWNYDSWKKDNVEHISKAFLGLTVNCAHCHDHKYDPITQEDYFRLRAIFEPLELRHDRVPGEADPGMYPKYEYGKSYPPITSGMVRVFDERLDAETFLYERGEARNVVAGRPAIPPGPPAFLTGDSFSLHPIELPATSVRPALKDFVVREELATRDAAIAAAETSVAASRAATGQPFASDSTGDSTESTPERAQLQLRIDEATLESARVDRDSLLARIAAETALADASGDAEALARAASKAERVLSWKKATVDLARAELAAFEARVKASSAAAADPEAAAAAARVAEATRLVETAKASCDADSTSFTPLGPVYPPRSTGRRAAFAKWLTARDNPLTARVAVNHIWRWHFGRPLVETTADFGRNGARPTHPQLLDWLAVELMNSGWDMRHLHRLIVTSEAYRLSSRATNSESEHNAADAANHWYWRRDPARMDAEVIRDSLLAVSGALDCEIGGPDIDLSQGLASGRRSLYFTHHGEARMPMLELFDAPDPTECYRRTTSVIPQQALALTNNEMLIRAAEQLEATLANDPAARRGRDDFLTLAFEQVLSRPPSPEELALTRDFLDRQSSLLADGGEVSSEHEMFARRGVIRALFNHNDFVTIR